MMETGRQTMLRLVNASKLTGITILVLGLAACGGQKNLETYQQAITQFETATDTTSNAASNYILSANAFVRQIEFERLEADSARELNLPKLIEGPYDPAAIRARQQAFATLNSYTTLLSSIASSDAPERWQTAATKLDTNASGFFDTLKTHSDAFEGSPLVDLTGNNGPLSQIISFAGTEFINMKRAQALDEAITGAKPAIDEISDALRRDFVRAMDLREIDATDNLLDAAVSYRQAQEAAIADPSKEAARIRELAALKAAVTTYDTQVAELGLVLQALDGFDAAHEQLVAYAQSDQTAADLSDLVTVINRYSAVALAVSESLEMRLKKDSKS
jgi:hypothetical protein